MTVPRIVGALPLVGIVACHAISGYQSSDVGLVGSDSALADSTVADLPSPMLDSAPADSVLADGALADGALADGALADGALADGALADGALADLPLPLPDGTPDGTKDECVAAYTGWAPLACTLAHCCSSCNFGVLYAIKCDDPTDCKCSRNDGTVKQNPCEMPSTTTGDACFDAWSAGCCDF